MADRSISRVTTRASTGASSSHTRHHHHRLHDLHHFVDELDSRDAAARYREEAADNTTGVHLHIHDSRHPEQDRSDPHYDHTHDGNEAASPSAASSSNNEDETLIVAWEENDPENPYNWSPAFKVTVLILANLTVINSTMASSLPSNAIPFMAKEWDVTNQTQLVLPMSTYLIGYILGPLVWAPLSEQYGRRWITIVTFAIFMVWTMACALAHNWVGFLFFRLLTGVFGSAPLAVVSGILADIFGDPQTRGRAMAVFMAMTVFGPLLAPIISGYCADTIGWRWTFWIGLMYAGACFVPLVFLPETYGPVLLKQRAEKMRAAAAASGKGPETTPGGGIIHVVAPHELERASLRELATVVLTRPWRMVAFELIVSCTCIYLSLVYAIFYMTFQAFPIIFEGIYGFSPGVDGLIFLAVGGGALLSLPIFYLYDAFLDRAAARQAPWMQQEEYRRVPLACIGGPLYALSLFWLGWTARSDVSFVAPMLAGLPLGLGYMLIFMALLNYLTDAYEIFAASAAAAASCARAMLATVLPLASTPMFNRLGVPGACSLLGGLSLLMCVIPFIFIWKGEQIRAGSRFCIVLRERKEEMKRRIEAQRLRMQALQQQREQQGLIQPLPKQPQQSQQTVEFGDNNNMTESSREKKNDMV